jgi:hypothetical protein
LLRKVFAKFPHTAPATPIELRLLKSKDLPCMLLICGPLFLHYCSLILLQGNFQGFSYFFDLSQITSAGDSFESRIGISMFGYIGFDASFMGNKELHLISSKTKLVFPIVLSLFLL